MESRGNTFKALISIFMIFSIFIVFLPYFNIEIDVLGMNILKTKVSGSQLLSGSHAAPDISSKVTGIARLFGKKDIGEGTEKLWEKLRKFSGAFILPPLLLHLLGGIAGLLSKRKRALALPLFCMTASLVVQGGFFLQFEKLTRQKTLNNVAISYGSGVFYMLGISILLFILMIACTVYYRERRNAGSIRHKQDEKFFKEPEETFYELAGLSGEYAGGRIPLYEKENLSMGSDSGGNNLIFPASAGICNDHCKIVVMPSGNVQVCNIAADMEKADIYINGKKMLHRNAALYAGDILSLGNGRNRFRLEYKR